VTDAEFQAAFDQHKDAVCRFAWRMSGSASAAEDITQDVFVGLLRHPDRFDPDRGAMRAFLLGIARNLALKRWRKEHRLEPLDDETLVTEPVDLGRGEVGDIVGRAVQALRPLQSEVPTGPAEAPNGALTLDTRLPARDTVAGLEIGGESVAYPFPALRVARVSRGR
jgi:RNA polymerase sigma-70 factor (ECF subfamily)